MSTAVQEKSILLELDFRPLKMSDKTFFDFCQRNKDYRFEMDK